MLDPSFQFLGRNQKAAISQVAWHQGPATADRRGIHVELAGLPLAAEAHSALALIEKARAVKTVLLAASRFRFMADLEFAKGILAGGGIGDVVAFQLSLTPPALTPPAAGPASEFVSPLSGAALIHMLGPEAFDLARYLFGEPQSVLTARQQVSSVPALSDSILVSTVHRNGTEGEIVLNPKRSTARMTMLSIQGSEGLIEIGWTASFYRALGEEAVQIGNGYNEEEADKRLSAAFESVAAGESKPWTTLEDLTLLVETVQAAQQSLISGQTVELPSFLRRMAA